MNDRPDPNEGHSSIPIKDASVPSVGGVVSGGPAVKASERSNGSVPVVPPHPARPAERTKEEREAGTLVVSQGPDYISWVLRLIVGGAFVAAGVLKILGPAKFAVDVSNYRLVPHDLIHWVAIVVPGIELVAGMLVLAGLWLRPATLVITGMTVMFFGVIVSALARGLNIECGCFGTVGGKHVGLVNLAIDTSLFFLSVWLLSRTKPTADPSALPQS